MELKKLLLSATLGLAVSTAVAQSLPNISGIVNHLDASEIIGLSDGDPVGTWEDLVEGNDATSPVSDTDPVVDARPTYVASSAAFNNKPTLSFDGVDDFVDVFDAVNVTSFTVFVYGGTTNPASGESYIMSGYTSGNNRLRIATYGAGRSYAFSVGEFGTPEADGALIDDKPHALVINSNVDAWVDGTVYPAIGTNGGAATDIPDIRLGNIFGAGVGANPGKGFLQGEIAEVIIYNRVLTDAETKSVNDYLLAKYAVTATVKDFASDVNFSVYPNPSSGNITIKADSDFAVGAKLNVFDMTGRSIVSKKLYEGTSTLDISNLSTGNYILKVINNGKTVVKQISKQ